LGRPESQTYHRTTDLTGREVLWPISQLWDIWRIINTPDWLLFILNGLGYQDQQTLRLFGCWCARQSWSFVSPTYHRDEVIAAEWYASGYGTRHELASAHRMIAGGATGAGVCGLPRRLPSAAAQLASFHATNQDGLHCAYHTAKFAAKAAFFSAWQESNDEASARAAENSAALGQCDRLREMVNLPYVVCADELHLEPNLIARLLVFGYRPRLEENGGKWHWRLFSEFLDDEWAFEDVIEEAE